MSNPDKKNPYRELASVLQALPEGNRALTAIIYVTDPRTREATGALGCAFGSTYPEAARINKSGGHLTWPPSAYGHDDPFTDWVRALGGDTVFVTGVTLHNGNCAGIGDNADETKLRYHRMLEWLDDAALLFDLRKPVLYIGDHGWAASLHNFDEEEDTEL